MKYFLTPTKVYVCFYNRSEDWRGQLNTLLCWTQIHHCGIMLHQEDKKILLVSDKTHKAKFIDADRFHNRVYAPTHVTYLGEADVSIKQLTDYVGQDYKGDARSLITYCIITRFFMPTLKPLSCALLTSQLLRMCGFDIGHNALPKELFKELTNAVNSNCWTSWSWEDYSSQSNS